MDPWISRFLVPVYSSFKLTAIKACCSSNLDSMHYSDKSLSKFRSVLCVL